MVKKNFTVLSKRKCVVTGQFLKQNLVDRDPNANMIYKYYQMIIRKNHKFPMDSRGRAYLRSLKNVS